MKNNLEQVICYVLFIICTILISVIGGIKVIICLLIGMIIGGIVILITEKYEK